MAFYISDALLEEYINDCCYTSLISCMHQAIIHNEMDKFKGRVIGIVKSTAVARAVDWAAWLLMAENYCRESVHYSDKKGEPWRPSVVDEQRALNDARRRGKKK
jgi:hypothetical protein